MGSIPTLEKAETSQIKANPPLKILWGGKKTKSKDAKKKEIMKKWGFFKNRKKLMKLKVGFLKRSIKLTDL